MKHILLFIVFLLVVAIWATDWKSLGVACEPLDTTYAFPATTIQPLSFRAGPGTDFAVMGMIPQGEQVTVLGWLNCGWGHADRSELWVRAEYGGKRGWLCAYSDGERLLERDGGPLFPIRILIKNPRELDKRDLDVPAGETVEFISNQNPYDYIYTGSLLVKWGSALGYIYKHSFEPEEYEDLPESIVEKAKQEELLEYPKGFWELGVLDNHKQYLFDYIDAKVNENTHFYSGPGFDYPELDLIENGSLLFVEGKWALVQVFPAWGWIYIGDEIGPKIRVYSSLAVLEAPYPEGDFPEIEDGGAPGMSLGKDIWPKTTHLMLECWGAYFCELIKVMKIKGLKIYQPPESLKALENIRLSPVIKTGWHETIIRKYPITFKSNFDPGKPFRLIFTVDYGKYGSFPAEIKVGE